MMRSRRIGALTSEEISANPADAERLRRSRQEGRVGHIHWRDDTPNLFVDGTFQSHAGVALPFKIDADALTDTDLATIAHALVHRLPEPFSAIEGVPTGGLRLADAFRPYLADTGPLLIVDDVSTTGGSLEEHRRGRDAIGAVIFDRGERPDWCVALFAEVCVDTGFFR